MARFFAIFRKITLTLYLTAIHLLALFAVYQIVLRPYFVQPSNYLTNVGDPTEKTPVPTPLPIPPPVIEPTAAPTEFPANQSQNNTTEDAPATLMIPVIGIKREQLQNTFEDARSEGRVHNAIDIIAPSGTPVIAAADGEIVKFFDSERGGITIYQYSLDRKFVYYYAHLQKRAENVNEKDLIKRGTVIGYVGDTGNAGAGNYHLHFAVTILTDPKNYHEGTEINPYPLLMNGIETR
ncbi:MAG: M23 family metallopeptidase [Acidobacteriota bacterium]|nr:M23 family metallopeptidase [Acidobacteriota bacterium]